MARADDAKNDAIVLSPVVVSEENSQPKLLTGKAEEGYRQTNVNLGPLGDRPILDTPYSVYAVPADLIKNEQVSNYTDLIKYMPSLMQQAHVGSLEIGPPVVRGMVADDSSMNTRIDGMNVRADTVLPFPLYESYQVLTGPSGALYGFSYPAGTLNGVLKRPTDEPFVEVGTDYMSDANGGLRADLGGHLDDGHKVGYRANRLGLEAGGGRP